LANFGVVDDVAVAAVVDVAAAVVDVVVVDGVAVAVADGVVVGGVGVVVLRSRFRHREFCDN